MSRVSKALQTQRGIASAILVAGFVLIAVFRPETRDLIAEQARAHESAAHPFSVWWTDWYGGITTPSYSVIAPLLMGWFGARLVGAVATAALVAVCMPLLRTSSRPRLAAILLALGVLANLVDGRVTFALGAAFGVLAARLVYETAYATNVSRRRSNLLYAAAVVSGLLATLSSPLAGLFMCVALLSALRAPGRRRIAAIVVIAGAALVVGVVSVLYPLDSKMPAYLLDACLAMVACALVVIAQPSKYIREIAVMTFLATLATLVLSSPIGYNIVRLPLVAAPAVVAATSRLSMRRLLLVLIPLVAWPAQVTFDDVSSSLDWSTRASAYQPLLAELPSNMTSGYRIEIVSTNTRGEMLYVPQHVAIARGWERQVDVARNQLFYSNHLSAGAYRSWLDHNAVAWVALPKKRVDFSATQEAALVASQPGYLKTIWENNRWRLFAVTDPQPIAGEGLTVTSRSGDSLVVHASGPASGLLRIAWSPGLVANHGACVSESNGQAMLKVPAGGDYLVSHKVVSFPWSNSQAGNCAGRRAG